MCVEMWSNLFSRFRDDERGLATIESLLWMPVFFYLFILITDVSFIFFSKAEALRIIQDGNRLHATGFFDDDDADASEYIRAKLSALAPSVVSVTRTTGGLIETNASMSARELMAVGSIPAFADTEIGITSQQYKEN